MPEPATSGGGTASVRYEEKVVFDRQLEITSDGSGGLAHAHKGSKGKGKAREVQQPSTTPGSTPVHERSLHELHAEQQEAMVVAAAAATPASAEDGIWLEKGTTGFEFSFIIPSSSPPFERHKYGRVRYGKLGKLLYSLAVEMLNVHLFAHRHHCYCFGRRSRQKRSQCLARSLHHASRFA